MGLGKGHVDIHKEAGAVAILERKRQEAQQIAVAERRPKWLIPIHFHSFVAAKACAYLFQPVRPLITARDKLTDEFCSVLFVPLLSLTGQQQMPSAAPLNATCHGRVVEDDFERMVPAQWWKHVFADAYYLKTDGDVVEDPEITKEELKY